MIDTDKYDYENIQEWVVSGNTVLSVAPPENRIVATNLTIQDAQLIADTPLLLAEVKRLRKVLKDAEDVIRYALEMSSDDDSTRVFEDYLEMIE